MAVSPNVLIASPGCIDLGQETSTKTMQRILQDIKRRYHTPDINNTFTHREEVQESVYVNRDQTNLWTNTKRGAAGGHYATPSNSTLLSTSQGKGSAAELPLMAQIPSASSAINTILLMLHIKSTYRPLSKPFPLKKNYQTYSIYAW